MEARQKQHVLVYTGGMELDCLTYDAEEGIFLYRGNPFFIQLPSFQMTEWDETNSILLHTPRETPHIQRARAFMEKARLLVNDPTPTTAPIFLYCSERPSIDQGERYTCLVKMVVSTHGMVLFQAGAFRTPDPF
jgi:hypothetical protein